MEGSTADKARLDERETAIKAAEICVSHKAGNVIVYDVKQSTMLADYYLICSGTSEPHLRALAEHIEKDMIEFDIHPRRVDGSPASRWIIMDYGVAMIHIFHPEMRQYYEIEKLWQEHAEIIFAGGDEPATPIPIF